MAVYGLSYYQLGDLFVSFSTYVCSVGCLYIFFCSLLATRRVRGLRVQTLPMSGQNKTECSIFYCNHHSAHACAGMVGGCTLELGTARESSAMRPSAVGVNKSGRPVVYYPPPPLLLPSGQQRPPLLLPSNQLLQLNPVMGRKRARQNRNSQSRGRNSGYSANDRTAINGPRGLKRKKMESEESGSEKKRERRWREPGAGNKRQRRWKDSYDRKNNEKRFSSRRKSRKQDGKQTSWRREQEQLRSEYNELKKKHYNRLSLEQRERLKELKSFHDRKRKAGFKLADNIKRLLKNGKHLDVETTRIKEPTFESFPVVDSSSSDDGNRDDEDVAVHTLDYADEYGMDEDILDIRSNNVNDSTGSNNTFDMLNDNTDNEASSATEDEEYNLADDADDANDSVSASGPNDTSDGYNSGHDGDIGNKSLDSSVSTTNTGVDNDGAPSSLDGESGEENSDADETLEESMDSLRRSSGGPSRFFEEEDISIRCYRCGGVGHIAKDCVNEPLKRCCFRCGESGHDSRSCTNEVCYNCYETGHIASQCQNKRRRNLDISILKNPFKNMKPPFPDFDRVRCMSCDKLGHINCQEVMEFGPIEMYCYMCGKVGHHGSACSHRYGNYANRDYGSNNRHKKHQRVEKSCYECGQSGHIAKDCQVRELNARRRGNRYSFTNRSARGNQNSQNRRSSGTFMGQRSGKYHGRHGRPIGRGGHTRR